MNFKFGYNRRRKEKERSWYGNHKNIMILNSMPRVSVDQDFVFTKRKKKVVKLSRFFKIVLKHYPKLKQYWKDSELLSQVAEESLLTESFQKEFFKILKIEIKSMDFNRLKFLDSQINALPKTN